MILKTRPSEIVCRNAATSRNRWCDLLEIPAQIAANIARSFAGIIDLVIDGLRLPPHLHPQPVLVPVLAYATTRDRCSREILRVRGGK